MHSRNRRVPSILDDLLKHYGTSTALAHQLEISRMSLLNWRERPDSIRDENLLRLEMEWHQAIWMSRYQEGEIEKGRDQRLPENFDKETALQSTIVDSLSFGSLEVETGTSERNFRKATQELEIPKNIDAAQYLAIQNIYSVTRRILRQYSSKEIPSLTSAHIRELHYTIMQGIRTDAGEYSSMQRILPQTDLQLTAPEDISDEIKYWISKYASSPSLADIAASHAHFELIHPFGDGNGRVGRALIWEQCLSIGLMPPEIDQHNKALYYVTLEHAQRTGDTHPLHYMFQLAQERLLRTITQKTKPDSRWSRKNQ